MTHHQSRPRRWLGAACAAGAALAAMSVGAPGARADDAVACPNSVETPYSMQLKALTGPAGADLAITVAVDPASNCGRPEVLKKVQVQTLDADGVVASTKNLKDVAAPGGAVDLKIGNVPRGRRIEVNVLVQTGEPQRTFVLQDGTTTLLRPDLVVTKITPAQALAGAPFELKATLAERNGDVDADADVTVSAVPGATQHVTVPRSGTATVTFPVTFTTPAPVEVTVGVGGAVPAETDVTNNDRKAVVDVTGNELKDPYRVLFPSLLGYGAQFNMHLYAPITPWPPGTGYGDVEAKVKALEPQLVRIFYNDNWDGNANGKFPDYKRNYQSFVDVVELAQQSGATIEISFQNLGNVRNADPQPAMSKFADVFVDLIRNHGFTNVLWAEVGNESNSGGLPTPTNQGGFPLDQYEHAVRVFHTEMAARGLEGQVKLMGPGLVENSGVPTRDHYTWMQAIATDLGDIVDAYAEHVYWQYDNPGRLEYRLRDSVHVLDTELLPEQRKPLYMMEFGVRGYASCPGKPYVQAYQDYYTLDPTCPDIWRQNIAGFQQFWFNVDSAQLAIAGTSKWDAYWGRYDNSSVNNQYFEMIGPPTEGSPLMPTYYAMSLLFHTVAPGWKIIGLDPWDSSDWSVPAWRADVGDKTDDQPEQELVAYSGPGGELTIVGLDTHGRTLNARSTEPPSSYSIGGLPPNTTFTLAEWNATGDGTNSIAGPVTTNAAGVARFEVPLQAAFSLTTVPVS